MAPHIVLLVLLARTLQLAGPMKATHVHTTVTGLIATSCTFGGGLSVIQTGPPIMVSLANEKVMFGCSITYQYKPQKPKVSYFYTDLQGHTSSMEDTGCSPGQGIENQTSTYLCNVTPKLHSAKATGTYYCSVLRESQSAQGKGTFILVRDSGYHEPPEVSQKTLLFCCLGILLVLSVLGTALLLWRKKLVKFLQKPPTRKCWDPRSASSSQQPATTDSIYTDLQRQDTQVYACLQSPTPSQNLLPQSSGIPNPKNAWAAFGGARSTEPSGVLGRKEKARGLERDSDGQLVYENL
ncbi:NFAT activation molecule 1 [Suncus etruscus]|uniref:NFAT activation molecule 1 n=1 Tax=Suncus etruscus TaxID=109475 RepID=UPI00210F7FD8|nr:NFAT activation molecule 1 [Suncus etruscus]